ncbi:DUF2177 family protein [Massilia antarctica]|uniref:DUF2177 family protein n=1 Tax=Massilia antarctica TaxID=2765360 RepID=UPI0006BB783E|nr:DUF2177 family protein [Massilia sp. H27-R4]MCY0913698.1 DUF2177 family protein [Massilia sp. H27-R4]CUI04630.1 FIG00935161: hypothetical protein [Janthinobacterium sp. CG23_2]CUU28416.1 FIG00935161: hypothetical protein [Janthinobacterium sp. CG23_2]
MRKLLIPYLILIAGMVLLDVLWLGFIAKSIYADGIGHLMAAQPRFGAAIAFYLLYALGLTIFVLAPHGPRRSLRATLAAAALFGTVAYATYDLSNLATLRDWPLSLALIDIAWGCVASTLSVLAAKTAMDRLAPA